MSYDEQSCGVAVVGAGLAGLACATQLQQLGLSPVVFEADHRCGGRCSAQMTPVGLFDDGAQYIAEPRPTSPSAHRLAALPSTCPWSVPGAATDEDDEDSAPALRRIGLVGVPSMQALPQAMAGAIDVRLRTPIREAFRRNGRWVLHDDEGEIGESFAALALALPAPQALPLASSPSIAARLSQVRFRPRWVLLVGSSRPLGLPAYREHQGGPIERVAAMHAKPGRLTTAPQERWFVEADAHWSEQHVDADAETVAELMLANLSEHAGRPVMPSYLAAKFWAHGVVDSASPAAPSASLWDDELRVGVCGDSVVASRLDRVVASGQALAERIARSLQHATRRAPRRPADSSVPLVSSFTDREDKLRRMVLLV